MKTSFRKFCALLAIMPITLIATEAFAIQNDPSADFRENFAAIDKKLQKPTEKFDHNAAVDVDDDDADLVELFSAANSANSANFPAALNKPYTKNAAVENEAMETAPHFRLTYDDAQEALEMALVERGAGDKITAQITSRSGGSALFSYNHPISVEIRGLRFDSATHRFNANLVAVSGTEIISARAVSGRFDRLVEVPVLRRTMRSGDVIKSSDIELRDYSEARARYDIVADISSLLGKTPQRTISAGRPIRSHELVEEAVVKKNTMVTMFYTQGAMQITTSGQAQSDGAIGSLIGVKNLSSGKIIQAVVTGDKSVEAGSGAFKSQMQTAEQAPYNKIYDNQSQEVASGKEFYANFTN